MKIATTIVLIFFFISSALAQTTLEGCTDPQASNFSSTAEVDDGSCCYNAFSIAFISSSNASLLVFDNQGNIFGEGQFPGTINMCLPQGCLTFYLQSQDGFSVAVTGIDQNGENYSISTAPGLSATVDFTLGEGIVGCMTPGACNYNPLATCFASCTFECYGCTNPEAFNYDPTASVDDGTCCTNPETYYTIESDGIVDFTAYDPILGLVVAGEYPTVQGFCMDQPCFELNIQDNLGQPANVTIFNQGNIVYSGSVDNFTSIYLTIGSNGITGCADPNACNYDPNATCSNFTSCTYDCYGCTDPEAVNYNESATIDDGTCCSSENYLSVTANSTFQLVLYNSNYYNSIYINSGETVNFCLPNGCYIGYASNLIFNGQSASLSINDSAGNILFQGTTDGLDMPVNISYNSTEGCFDTSACNFNPAANCSNDALCDYSCQGCTDPNASNFNPNAIVDDGSCCLEQWTISASVAFYYYLGMNNNYSGLFQSGSSSNNEATLCINPGCMNLTVYDLNQFPIPYTLTTASGDVIEINPNENEFYYNPYYFEFQVVSGCIDPNACNFNPEANCSDFSLCDYSCIGCTDTNAFNFNPDATIDDGSCCFENYYTIELSNEAYWSVFSNNNSYFYASGQYPQQSGFCFDGDCFSIFVYSINGMPIDYTIADTDGNILATGTSSGYEEILINTTGDEIFGCSDPSACNFDPNVTCGNWYLCDYSCYGCTDINAFNFDTNASIDDGSCCYENWLSVELSAPGYWSAYNFSDGFYASGFYPSQTGFCGPNGCFVFESYSTSDLTLSFSIMNAEGVILASGNSEGVGYVNAPISTGSEIPGCTDPNACNFNPEATCDAGNCLSICSGCTDSNALNFNADASFNDGSCVYQMESPTLGINVETIVEENEYYVIASVLNLGNGAPYIFSAQNSDLMTVINSNGQYVLGPFPCGEAVVVTLHSTTLGMMQTMESNPLNGNCLLSTSEGEIKGEQSILLYPNPAENEITIAGINESFMKLTIMDLTGRIVFEQQNYFQQNVSLDVSDLVPGMYLLSIQTADDMISETFVVKR